MRDRILDINPSCQVNAEHCFVDKNNISQINFSQYDYVVDAIDTVTSKLLLVEETKKTEVPLISSMGAGNKLDPTRFRVADIFETRVCPLAKVMRKELRARSIDNLKVVYSEEEPIKARAQGEDKRVPGSVAFVPSVVGLIIAGEVVKDLAGVGLD